VFSSEKLTRVSIQVPEEFVSAATAALARFRLLHLIRIQETPLGHLGYVAKTDRNLLQEFDGFFKEIKVLLDALGVQPEPVVLEATVIPEKDVFKVRETLEAIREETAPLVQEMRTAEQALHEKKALKEKFSLLPKDLDLSRLSGCRFVNWMIGLVPTRGLEKLEESLSEVHHAFIHIGDLEQRAVILVVGLSKDRSVFERALKGAFFDRVDIPEPYSGLVGDTLQDLDSQLAELVEKNEQLSLAKASLKKKFALELLLLKEKTIAARQILAAREFFGKIDQGYLITGWIPDRLFDTLKEELGKVTEGQVIIERVDPEDTKEVRGGVIRMPILLNNPLLISPFERLTGLYGTPRYREVDPTLFFALSFLLMFGMMFGDIGHGAVLFSLGYVIFRRFYRYMDYGIILMECGVVSALFGLLYGSLFGMEDIVPALWFRPLSDISYFVKIALIIGIALVSLGLALNLVNAVRLKEYEDLLSAGGLAGALFYWMLVGLGVKYFLTGRLAPNEISLFAWAAVVLALVIVLHRPLHRLLFKKEPLKRVLKRQGFFTDVVESFVEFLDDLIRYLSNTISFIRIAAFALAHAALFIAVFAMADVVAHEKGGGFTYWLVVAVGNMAIIALEGLVVSIQVVRLEYYEFFSKFFKGGGDKFMTFERGIDSRERSS